MGQEEQPISRKSFDNNADRLVFADRHEYRTRSRAEYAVYGVIFLALLIAGTAFVVWLFVHAARSPLQYQSGAFIEASVTAVLVLGSSPVLVWVVFFAFGFRPRVIVRPTGIELRDWPPKVFRLRRTNSRVEIPDITDMRLWTKGDVGRGGNRAVYHRHSIKFSIFNQDELVLPWWSYNKEQAERFMVAVAASIQEMVNRTQAGPFR